MGLCCIQQEAAYVQITLFKTKMNTELSQQYLKNLETFISVPHSALPLLAVVSDGCSG